MAYFWSLTFLFTIGMMYISYKKENMFLFITFLILCGAVFAISLFKLVELILYTFFWFFKKWRYKNIGKSRVLKVNFANKTGILSDRDFDEF